MCGFLFSLTKNDELFQKNTFLNVLQTLNRRGPDDEGYFETQINKFNLKFGFKRLSIQDLTINGHQPKISKSNSVIIFNGEIYNHNELRAKLIKEKSINLKSSGDTETLIYYLDYFGIENFLKNCEGMFSIIYFNRQKNKLYFIRDLTGEKPLYFSITDNYILCASDLFPFVKILKDNKQLNLNSIASFLNYSYVPTPNTIFKNIFKLPPASFIEIDINKLKLTNINSFSELKKLNFTRLIKWWQFEKTYKSISNNKFDTIKLETKNLIEKSIKKQLISDAPLGTFLSGGVDSSIVTAVASKHINKLKTFTVGYEFDEMDESKHAKTVSNFLKTDHETIILKKNFVIDSIYKIQESYSEPFADSSQIPTILLSEFASRQIKVALGGDGGDEIFGGYNRYLISNKYWKLINAIPFVIRNIIFKILLKIPKNLQNYFLSIVLSKNIISSNYNLEKIIIKLMNVKSEFIFFNNFISEYSYLDLPLINQEVTYDKYNEIFNSYQNQNIVEKMMKTDFNTYLHDDILCKVDRATMYNSLECRSPFLNRDLIEYSFNLSLDYKIKNGKSKILLKSILNDYMPSEIFNKPKMGFGIPLNKWFKDDLKEFMYDILFSKSHAIDEIINMKSIKKIVDDHVSNRADNYAKIWSIMQLKLWYAHNYAK